MLLHDPNILTACILLGLVVLGADAAWRSWHFEGRVAHSGWFVGRPAPCRTIVPYGPRQALPPAPVVAWHTLIDLEPAPAMVRPYVGSLPTPLEPLDAQRKLAEIAPLIAFDEPLVPERTSEGATEQWSPLAEIGAAGRSDEDWWSERLQQYDDALRWIDAAPRMADGTPSYAATGRNVAETLELFISNSQALHAYRLLRIGATGELPIVRPRRDRI